MAFSPDAEIKEEVLVELLQKWTVAIIENLLQQQLTGHQHIHVHHAARDLQQQHQQQKKQDKWAFVLSCFTFSCV